VITWEAVLPEDPRTHRGAYKDHLGRVCNCFPPINLTPHITLHPIPDNSLTPALSDTNFHLTTSSSVLNIDQPQLSMSSAADKAKITGTGSAAKDMGFGSFQTFLASYGLRVWNIEDVQEGRAILRAMGYGADAVEFAGSVERAG